MANCETCTNKNCFIKVCSHEWISKIASAKTEMLYKKGHHIFRHGDPVAGMYFILRGKVKVLVNGYHDREQIVRLANDGHILGHRGLGAETYPISAVAMEDSLICFVDNDTLKDAIMQNPKLSMALMMFYSRELRKTEIRMKYLGQMHVREKVAEALLLLMETFGINADSSLNVDISRQDIADIAGTTANRVTTQLNDLEDEKLIDRAKRKIIIKDAAGLKKVVAPFNVNQFFEQK